MNIILNIVIYFVGLLYINRFTDNSAFKILPLVLYFFGASRIFLIYNTKYPSILSTRKVNANLGPVWVLLAVLLVGLIRSSNPSSTTFSQINSTLNFIFFVLFVFSIYYEVIFVKNDFEVKYEKIIVNYIIYPFFLYVLINVVFWFLNITPGNDEDAEGLNIGESVLLSMTGLSIDRVKFPFATGMNSFAVIISGVLSMILAYIFVGKKYSIVNCFLALILLFAVILTDSRSALLYPILVCLAIGLINKTNKVKVLRVLPYLFFFGPVLMASLLPLLAQVEALEQFSRNSEDLLTGNARFFIWAASLNVLAYFEPIHLIGYGQYGHYSSGASEAWAFLFNKYENDAAVHPHNSAISILFDYGYIGGLFFFFLFMNISNKIINLWQSQKVFCVITSAFYMYFVLISITETFFGFYYINSMAITLSIFILIYLVDYKERLKQNLIKTSYDRPDKIYSVQNTSSSRAPIKRGPVYPGLVPIPAGAEK